MDAVNIEKLKMKYVGSDSRISDTKPYYVYIKDFTLENFKIDVFDLLDDQYKLCEINYRTISEFLRNWIITEEETLKNDEVIVFGNKYTSDEISNALSVVKMMTQFYSQSYKTGIITEARLNSAFEIIKDLALEKIKKNDEI